MAQTFGNSKLKVASLFCGCGGMDLGIQGGFNFLDKHYAELPFEVVYAVDNDVYATKIYNDNFAHKCETKDVRDIVPSEVPDHDILLGGFPCQSFSISAQNPPRLGYKDDIGYHIHYKLLNASEFGVPQKRERVFIVGFRDFDDYFNFKFPQPNTLNGSKIVLKQVIDKKADKDEKWFFSQRAVEGMLRVREKMNKGRVQDLNQPCNTISSHLAKVSLNGTDPVLMVDDRYRRFTPREAASIQSFPTTFKLESVSDNRQYRAIGNAVPPVLMWNVVNALSKLFVEEKNEQKKMIENLV